MKETLPDEPGTRMKLANRKANWQGLTWGSRLDGKQRPVGC
jgi:hypothetical protein